MRWLHAIGVDGLFSGAKHQFMVYEKHRLAIPSNAEYSALQLRMMIRETESILGRQVSVDEWNDL